MISVKCKMCGATNNVEESSSTFICEFCGNEQTKPNIVNNNKLVNLHNRANQCRQSCDFDGAIATYNSIISEDEKDAEAHWGLVLCKYGIEYVDDPKTRKKIPTCHRTLTKSIFDDIDYRDAIKYSDIVSRKLYEKEAEEIDRIQKSIMSLALKEEKYDIFICYKESDEHNNRTKDSVLAQQIYDELTKRKYRVFYARITLEGKLGSQYEPIIYAALYSSKVMLVIGSKKEYFNAVWVKNEWSRFLGMMEEDPSKVIIPCFRDLEAYDLPTELLNYQAQDMNKLGFIQDLTVGIEKIIGSKDKVQEIESKETNKYGTLLQRAEMAISDGDFVKADDFLERVLDLNPKESKAYFYKLLVEFKCKNKEELEKYSKMHDLESNNIEKILKFGNEDDKLYFESLREIFNETQTELKYQRALKCLDDKNFEEAINIFKIIGDYKGLYKVIEDSQQKQKELVEKQIEAKREELYQEAVENFNKGEYLKAYTYFSENLDYKDNKELCEQSRIKYLERMYDNILAYERANNLEKALELITKVNKFTNNNGFKNIYDIEKNIKTRIYENQKVLNEKIKVGTIRSLSIFQLFFNIMFLGLAAIIISDFNFDDLVDIYKDFTLVIIPSAVILLCFIINIILIFVCSKKCKNYNKLQGIDNLYRIIKFLLRVTMFLSSIQVIFIIYEGDEDINFLIILDILNILGSFIYLGTI